MCWALLFPFRIVLWPSLHMIVHGPCILWKQTATWFSSMGQIEGLQCRLLCWGNNWDGNEGVFSVFLTWWRSHFLDCCQMQNSLGPDVESHHPLMPHRPNGSGNPSVIRNELSSSWWRLKTPNPATPTGLLCPRIYGELPHPSLCFSQQSYETGSTGMIVPIIWMQRLGFRNAKWSA